MEITHKNLSLKELAQLALVEIYKEYQIHKGSENIDMDEIRIKLGLKGYDNRIIQITEFLADKNYIEIVTTMIDGISIIRLLPNAIIYLEETGDTSIKNADNMNDKIILNFFNKVDRSQINTQSNNNTQTNITNDLSLLDKLIETIRLTNEISISDKNDLFADIAIIKNEVTKSKPDKTFLTNKLELFSKFVPLIPYIPPILEWLKNL